MSPSVLDSSPSAACNRILLSLILNNGTIKFSMGHIHYLDFIIMTVTQLLLDDIMERMNRIIYNCNMPRHIHQVATTS